MTHAEYAPALSPQEVAATITGLHAQLFEAAARPMLPPKHTLARGSSGEWATTIGDIELHVAVQGESFAALPDDGQLATAPYMKVGVVCGQGVARVAGLLNLARGDSGTGIYVMNEKRQADQPLGLEHIAASLQALRQVIANPAMDGLTKTCRRDISIPATDGSTLAADETSVHTNGEPAQVSSSLTIKPRRIEGSFALAAHFTEEGLSLSEYRDCTDDRTGNVLTGERLEAIAQYGQEILSLLEQYHQEYMHMQPGGHTEHGLPLAYKDPAEQ